MQVPKRKSEMRRKTGRSDDHHLTAATVARLRRELEDLEAREQSKAIADTQRAAEMGDRSENAAYAEAKSRLMRINGRILSLRERLKNAIVIEPGADPEGRIRIGSTVVLRVNGNERIYEILGSQETNPGQGRISHLSPLGAALMNRKPGETATVETQGRKIEYEIVEVR